MLIPISSKYYRWQELQSKKNNKTIKYYCWQELQYKIVLPRCVKNGKKISSGELTVKSAEGLAGTDRLSLGSMLSFTLCIEEIRE